MNTRDIAGVLARVMSEFILGSLDPEAATVALNRGDDGLLKSLDKISASAASSTHAGGASIAAHVDHLRYGLSLLNRWAAGEDKPWVGADWTQSWKKTVVDESEWSALRTALRREGVAWIEALRTPRHIDDSELGWMTGSIAHLAYHLGAIRQIDRDARGPTAEDERRIEQGLRPR